MNFFSPGLVYWNKCEPSISFHRVDYGRKECDPGLEEAIKTIIFAAPRSESKELQEVLSEGDYVTNFRYEVY